MRKYGLIGYPLSHSFSPGYFKNKFETEGIEDAQYDIYPLERIEKVEQLLSQNLAGFNVTIPYKEAILPYLDSISSEAEMVNAVNTVKIIDGTLKGFNTDVIGFRKCIVHLIGDNKPSAALILGSGGAAKAVSYVLDQLEIENRIVSRKSTFNYDSIKGEVIQDYHLIINTTPLGMYPKVDAAPDLSYDRLSSQHMLFDLIYNPEKTLFLKRGELKGARVQNGLEMLHIQADEAWNIWQNENNQI